LSSNDFILETKQLTREFKGFIAVDNVNLQVKRGAIHALIGPNGAGKTTVFNLLTKFLAVSSGQIIYNGQDITTLKAAEVALILAIDLKLILLYVQIKVKCLMNY